MNKWTVLVLVVLQWAVVETAFTPSLLAYHIAKPGIVFVYFNGALATFDQASEAKERFKLLHGETLTSGYRNFGAAQGP